MEQLGTGTRDRVVVSATVEPAAALHSSSSTAGIARHQPRGGGLVDQLVRLPEPTRVQMALIARQAANSDEALAPIIDLLVDGSPAKRAAIVNAFRTNEPLREQWLRTYEILRA